MVDESNVAVGMHRLILPHLIEGSRNNGNAALPQVD